jgi:hypothetical protein
MGVDAVSCDLEGAGGNFMPWMQSSSWFQSDAGDASMCPVPGSLEGPEYESGAQRLDRPTPMANGVSPSFPSLPLRHVWDK